VDRFMPLRVSKRLENKERSYIEDLVGDRYANSNRESSKLIQINLKELGYTLLGD
jgi:hypothetical protein